MSATSTRTSSLLLLALLAACSRGGETASQDRAQPTLRIPCAHDGAALAATCTVERTATDRGTVLIVRHADGGFRRLLVTADGRGVIAADGAQPAGVALSDGGIEVRVGDDRYRLPATVKGAPGS